MHTKTYIFPYFSSQYLVLFTMVPQNRFVLQRVSYPVSMSFMAWLRSVFFFAAPPLGCAQTLIALAAGFAYVAF